MMKGWLVGCAALVAIALGGAAVAADEGGRENPEQYWDFESLAAAPAYRPAGFPDSESPGLRALLFDGAEVDGARAPVFAYFGFPEGPVPPGGFPGVVLVHGGGGTAFPNYAKLWISYGYAVVAFDWVNQRPLAEPNLTEANVKCVPLTGGARQRHEVNIANIVLAHSLLRGFPEVNPDKTALVGLSWGSWYGAAAAALDPRFKCAVQIYCGDRAPEKKSIVDGRFLHAAKVPMYWIAGTNDRHATPESLQRGFDECPTVWNKSIVRWLPHSHIGFTFPVCRRVVDHFLLGAPPLPKLGKNRIEADRISAPLLNPGKGVREALLCCTFSCDEPVAYKREWQLFPATVVDGVVSAKIPDGAYQFYLTVYDDVAPTYCCGSGDVVTRR